jgi:carboxynorspermidine decarboxylase
MKNIDNRFEFQGLKGLDVDTLFKDISTPFFALDEAQIEYDGNILLSVQQKTGCKILLAQKAFSNYDLYPLMEKFVAGTEASGLYEARLGKEEMPSKEVHVFCAAYKEDEFDELLKYADHIVFNTINQFHKYARKAKEHNKSVGLRINPECSTQVGHEMYDPCTPGSRLGVPLKNFIEGMSEEDLQILDGLHFHTLCQQNSDDLEKTLVAVEEKFGKYLSSLKWINFGGGHHITREDYDVDRLIRCINYIQDKYNVEVYLEPGEACVLNAGYLVTRVLDTFKNGDKNIALVDCSAACHMPDVLECHFLPPLLNANLDNEGIRYKLGGPTCLSGDNIGEYIFKEELKENEILVFGDCALYTTCKTNTFNGMPLPNIYILHKDKSLEKLTDFNYFDFKNRLGKTK